MQCSKVFLLFDLQYPCPLEERRASSCCPDIITRILQQTTLVIPECLLDLLLSVHDKGPILYNGLIDWLASHQQEAHASLALCRSSQVASTTENQSLRRISRSHTRLLASVMSAAPEAGKL